MSGRRSGKLVISQVNGMGIIVTHSRRGKLSSVDFYQVITVKNGARWCNNWGKTSIRGTAATVAYIKRMCVLYECMNEL